MSGRRVPQVGQGLIRTVHRARWRTTMRLEEGSGLLCQGGPHRGWVLQSTRRRCKV